MYRLCAAKTPESTRHPGFERVDDGYARDFLKVFLVFRDDNLDAMFEHAYRDQSVPKGRPYAFYNSIALMTLPALRSMTIHREERSISATIVFASTIGTGF